MGDDGGARTFRVDRVGDRLHFVQTEHVNWAVYLGSDGVTLVDSGYPGQRDLLIASLRELGCHPEDVSAVLITHGHADHLGGAVWLAAEFGTPVHAAPSELPNIERTVVQQAGPADVLRNAWRPGVLPWALAILPLLDGTPHPEVRSATPLPEVDGRVDVPGHPTAVIVDGHTSGHVVYEFDGRVLVVGDALVTRHRTSRAIGPQLLPSMFHHDGERARASLGALRGSSARVVLPGHGEAWIGPVDAAVDLAMEAGAAW